MSNTWKWIGEIHLGDDDTRVLSGTGDPTGVVSANPGSLYIRIDGSAGTSLYVKESGSGNTGWSSVTTSSGAGPGSFPYPDQLIVVASTTLTAGQLVTIFKDVDNIVKARPTNPSVDTSVSGYVIQGATVGQSVTVFFDGTFSVTTTAVGLANVGARLYLGATGVVALSGNSSGLYQRIGTLAAYNVSTNTATIFFAPSGLVKTDVQSFPIDTSAITSGLLGLNRGGTATDLSATGGASRVLRQSSVGSVITVSQLAETDLSFSDNLTNNVSVTKHGFAPKSPNDATKYLDGTGNYTVPAGSGTGTVSNVAMTGDNVIFNTSVTGSPITSTGTLAPSLKTQSSNLVLAGPTTGIAATPTFRSLVGADLPAPSASTLGGIQSIVAVTSKWIDSISTLGVPHASQPSVSDLSTGVTGTGVIALANSPTFLGSVLFGDGTSSTPGMAFSGQTNTGIYRPASGQISLVALGVVAATFVSSGVVNIATGIQIAGAAASGNVLRGNGTSFVSSTLAASDLSNGVSGSGAVSLVTSPTFVTPILGIASATELDVTTITLDAANKDVILTRSAAATLQLGAANAASPINQTLTTQGSRGGTDLNVPGSNLTVTSGKGTGNAASSSIAFQTPTVTSSSTTAQVLATRISITSSSMNPGSAGGLDLGAVALPFSNLYVGAAATNNIKITGTATAARQFTLPDANSNPVQPATAAAHQFATSISSAGVITFTQPAESDLSVTDITTNNVSITAHGFAPKLPNDATKFLNGTGLYTVPSRTASISYVIDGGGAVPTTGAKGQINIPIACTVTGWVLTADASGSAVIDVLRSTFAGFPTTASIAGTDKPTLSAVQKNENLGPLSAWGSTALAAGDQVQLSLSSVTTCQRLNLTLVVTIP